MMEQKLFNNDTYYSLQFWAKGDNWTYKDKFNRSIKFPTQEKALEAGKKYLAEYKLDKVGVVQHHEELLETVENENTKI